MSVKLWRQKIVSILCSMALLWQSFLSLPSYAADDGALIAKRNFMQAFQSQMAIANPTAEDFSSMLNAAKNVQKNLNDNEKSVFEQKILTPLNAYQNATKVIDDCSCQDGDCSMKNLNLNFDLFTGDANSQCQRQKSILDDDFKNFLNSFNAVNVKLVTPDSFKRGGEGQSKQKNLKDFRDLLVAQTQEDLLLPYIKLSRNFRGPLPKNSKDLMSKLKVTAKKEQPLMSKVQEVLEEEIPESAENNVNTRREQLFTGLKKQLKDINTIYNEEADYDQAQIQIDRIAPSPWAKNRSWIAPAANDSTLAVQREEIKQLFPAYDFDSKATTIDEVAAPIFQAQTFAAESTLSLPETTSIRILRQPKIIAPVPSRKINESVVPNYLKIKYGIVARGQKQFVGSEEDRALEEKKLTLDLKKYFMTFLLPQKSDLSHADKEKMADEFVRNLDENLDTSFREMQKSRKGASYSIMGGSALNFDDEHPYIKEQTKKAKTSQVQLGFSDTRSPNTRKFSVSMMNNQDLNQEQIIGWGIRSAIQNVNTPSGTSLDSFLQKKVSANFKQRRQIADALKGNPIFFNGKKGLGSMLYRGDPEANKEDMQAALDDYFTKTEELLLDLEKNYDQDDPEDQIASILKRNPALIARVLSKNPQYASLVCDLKKKFIKDQKSSEVWDKIFFSAGMVLMGAAVILTAGAALGVFAVAGAVTATLGAAGLALGAVGTTRGAMSSAELFQEAREANEYLVALGVGNQEEVQKLLDNANRKMRDTFIEGGMTAIGGTGLGLTGKIFRYARGRNPAAVKVMLQEAAASKEGAKKMARTLEADTVSSTSVALNAKKYKTKEMLIKYEGEEKRLGQTFVSVKYLTDFERKAHQVYPKKGKFYDASGNLVCTGSPCKGIFVMDENGNLFFKQDPVEGEFHHSSFFGGHPVASAGEFEFIDGKLIMLKDKSGHYAPTTSDMKQVIDELDVKGIKLDKEQIDLSFSSNQAAKNQLSDQLEKNTDAREVRRKVDALIGVEPATLASMERGIERKVAAGNFESLVPQDKVIAIEKVLGRKLTDSEMEKLFTRSDWHELLSSGEYLKLSEKKIIKEEVLFSNEKPITDRNNDGASALEPKVAPAKPAAPEKKISR